MEHYKVRDTFLHLIADNLDDVPVHVLRDDPNDRSAGVLKTNAANLSFLDVRLGNGQTLSSVQAVIDILNDDENTATDWVEDVWAVLSAAFYAPILDYSDPSEPVETGRNITWDSGNATFKRVLSVAYTHYSCIITLRFPAI